MKKVYNSDIWSIAIQTVRVYDVHTRSFGFGSHPWYSDDSSWIYENLQNMERPEVRYTAIAGPVLVNGKEFMHFMFLKINGECYLVGYKKRSAGKYHNRKAIRTQFLVQFDTKEEGNQLFKAIIATNPEGKIRTKLHEAMFKATIPEQVMLKK